MKTKIAIMTFLLCFCTSHRLLTSYQNGGCRSKEEIMGIVNSYIPGMNSIYNTHLLSKPSISGKLIIRFVIDTMGKVIYGPEIKSSSLGDSILENDFIQYVKTWDFGKSPIKCSKQELIYPFYFDNHKKNGVEMYEGGI